MNVAYRSFLILLLLGAFSLSSQADTIVLNFDGLADEQTVADYYNGGGGGDYGITFTSNAIAVNEFDENEGMLPTPPNGLTFLSGTAATLDDASGFTNGFSFYYSAPFSPGVINVYSGLDSTGTVLATLNLPTTLDGLNLPGCLDHDFCPFVPIGITFSGTAESVDFGGSANQIVFDDLTISSAAPGLTSSPEPNCWMLVAMGVTFLAAWTRRSARRT